MSTYVFSFWEFLSVCMVCKDVLRLSAAAKSGDGSYRTRRHQTAFPASAQLHAERLPSRLTTPKWERLDRDVQIFFMGPSQGACG